MIWFTSRMKLDPKKERWDLSLVVKSFVLQKQCFSNLCSLYKTLSGFEHSVCQLPTFYILACVAGVFLVLILFLVRTYTAARGQKSKRRGEMARRRKRVFLTSLLASPPPPPPLPPSPSFSGSTSVLAFAQLYLLLYEPQKKKHQHQESTKIVVGKVRLDKSLPSG